MELFKLAVPRISQVTIIVLQVTPIVLPSYARIPRGPLPSLLRTLFGSRDGICTGEAKG